MTTTYVADTHALIWHLQTNPRLSARGRAIFGRVDTGDAAVVIPTVVLVEMIYLAEKKRIDASLVESALDLLRHNSANYQLALLDLHVVESLARISRSAAPDMPDRIIAATALALGLPLLTRDSALTAIKGIAVVW